MMTTERQEVIKMLQDLAKEVLLLKESHRQKRPIVIEFSGSPKSGKTSCINSLELFLKRNGFRVEIIQERASVCPVADKRSPMFNIWTACTSIAGMIGALEKKDNLCDVIILDRGVFDACCWFEWLNSKRMFENEQKSVVEQFLLMDSLVNRIDIVFAFQATAEVSIQREYANLLTDKPGSIMNKTVLEKYLLAVKNTIINKQSYFHKIFSIDTTDKNQDEVGKEVTEHTLKTLKDTLMERIGYFDSTNELSEFLLKNQTIEFKEFVKKIPIIQFNLRALVESDLNKLQPIPIAVITNIEKDMALLVKKTSKATSNDSPERNKSLLYIGGHSRIEDSTAVNANDLLSICKYTLRREIKEEIGISLALDGIEPFVIYTPNTQKSKQHVAICFIIQIDIAAIKLRLDSEELITTKGKSKSGRFYSIQDIVKSEVDNMESWSKLILKKCFNQDISPRTLFDLDYNK